MKTTLLLAMTATLATGASAQSDPTYVPFGGTTKGALYRPDDGSVPTVGILVMHRTANFLSHIATRELSERGYLVLAMNPRFENSEADVMWEDIALDVRSGVDFLRQQPDIDHVILFGHSGGGATMTFYQAVAEQGPSYCQGPNKLSECDDGLASLPTADAVVLMDAHPGNPVNGIRSLNPAVLDESDPHRLDPILDPFNPENGYHPSGESAYTDEFRQTYFRAQAARMNRLIDSAQAKLDRMERGDGRFPDDDVFLIVRGSGTRMVDIDPGFLDRTAEPRKLLRNDGTIVTQVVETVQPVSSPSLERTATFNGGTRVLTLRSFLSANAIRGTHSIDGLDHCSTNNSVPCAVQSITVPLLVTAMGAGHFIRDNEIHYELAASPDKDFVVIEGALHGATPCTECEATPGQYSNSAENFFDYVRDWIDERYPD
jgi:pimeloyl-ACP methyl ester carboxylesterase